jgi:hypothetical protein
VGRLRVEFLEMQSSKQAEPIEIDDTSRSIRSVLLREF